MPGWRDLQGVDANAQTHKQDDRVEHLRGEDREDHGRQARAADDEEAGGAEDVVPDFGPHGLERRVPDEDGHAPRGAEQAGDDGPEAIAEHGPAKVVVVADVLGHLPDLNGADGNGERHGDGDPEVVDHLVEVLEGAEVGNPRMPPDELRGLPQVRGRGPARRPGERRAEDHRQQRRGEAWDFDAAEERGGDQEERREGHRRPSGLGLDGVGEEPGQAH
mmetsp:Transcript_24222/g.72766  ORF Transcript_24222/g.72766 Transcript_24222/m.72766 type:complete len:219 (-) Transcript_24222:683-1339(-)